MTTNDPGTLLIAVTPEQLRAVHAALEAASEEVRALAGHELLQKLEEYHEREAGNTFGMEDPKRDPRGVLATPEQVSNYCEESDEFGEVFIESFDDFSERVLKGSFHEWRPPEWVEVTFLEDLWAQTERLQKRHIAHHSADALHLYCLWIRCHFPISPRTAVSESERAVLWQASWYHMAKQADTCNPHALADVSTG